VVAPTQYYGKGADGSYSASNDETEQVPQPSTFDQAAHVIGNLPGTIGRAAATLTGSDPNAPPAVALADPLDRPGTPPGAGQTAAAAPGAGGMGGSASVSTSKTTRTPGKGVVPPSAPDAYTQAVNDNAQLMQHQLGLRTELESKQLAGEARIQSEARVKAAELAAGDQARRTAELQEARKYEQGLAGLQNEVLQASKESVDPNRYWNSRDTGQKVAGIIAGALFGFTGQGMQWLQRVDGLIAQDMQAQAADLARKRGYLQDAAGLQNNLIAMAEKRGLKGDAAYTAAKLAMTENIAAQLEANAAQYQDPLLRIKATEAASAIRTNAQKDLMMYDQEKQDAIAKRSLMKAQENHLYSQMQNERRALELKAREGGPRGKPLPEAGVAKLNDYAQSALNIINMSELAKNSGPADRAQTAIRNKFPVWFSEEKAKVSAFESSRNDWMTGKARGALQPAETDRLEPLLGSPTDIGSDPSPKLRLAGQIALEQLWTAIAQHRANGWDTSEYERQYNELKDRLAASQIQFSPKGN
jgi:hypothetical protein